MTLPDSVLSLKEITNILFVDKGPATGTEDGTIQDPYHVVQDAITAAGALATAASPYLVYVWPGIYDEQITTADNVYVVGASSYTTIVENDANVLTVASTATGFWDLTFRSTENGAIVQSSQASSDIVEFHQCQFIGADNNNTSPVRADLEVTWRFFDCIFEHVSDANIIVELDDPDALVTIQGGSLIGLVNIDDGFFRLFDCAVEGSIDYDAADGADLVVCRNIIIAPDDCINFGVDPDAFVCHNNRLAAGAGDLDINANVTVTQADIEGNLMTRGMDSDVQTLNPVKRVGANAITDWYPTVADALASVWEDNSIVRLFEDEALSAQLAPPSYDLLIDGQNEFVLSRTAGIMSVGSGSSVIFHAVFLTGLIEVTGTGDLSLIDQTELTGQIHLLSTAASGSSLSVIDSKIVGDATNTVPIRISDSDPTILINRSYLSGNSGSAAVRWSASNDNLKIKWSTIMHGSLAANDPFARDAAQTPDFCAHHTIFNVQPNVAVWTNLIAAGQRMNSYDVNGDY